MNAAAERLRELRNPDGGWGATADRPSNTEATALAALAFAADDSMRAPAVAWLLAHQRQDGSWPWTEELDEASWATSEAVLALADAGTQAEVSKGVDWLLGREGRGFDWRQRIREFFGEKKVVELDGTLIGWPWGAGTFSWIEPTLFALLALKKALPGRRNGQARSRIREGEAMILDRECHGGGWNYGNKRVLGVDLPPYPDTTALALLALQGSIDAETRDRNLGALDGLVDSTGSGLALSLAALCRQAYGLDARDLLSRAEERFGRNGFLDDTRDIALAILAARRPEVLRLPSDD